VGARVKYGDVEFVTYLVLARKLRPQTFNEIVAQEHITETLKKAVQTGRIAHAYLFCGTRGTGKTSTARILAKALNCIEGPTAEPCLKCVNCREIVSSSSMDVIEIDAASNTGVDSIRDLRENVRYAPAGSRYKIYIIDEVHRLSGAAFDALLKTLEEPPAHVVFMFATTEPHNLPATILSRAQRYDFRRIPLTKLTESLRSAAEKENINITDDALALIARKGDGSLRDALSLFEQVLAYANDGVTVELISDALGLVDLNLLFDLTETIHNHDTRSLLEQVLKLTESGSDIGQFLIDFQEHLRNLLITASVPEPSQFLELSDLYIEKYVAQKDYFSESDILRMVQVISDLRQQLKEGAEPRIFLEMALLRLARMDTTATLTDVLKKLSGISSSRQESAPPKDLFNGTSSGEPSTAEKKSLILNKPTGDDEEVQSKAPSDKPGTEWKGFLDGYTQINGMLTMMLRKGNAEFVSDGILQLTFPPDSGIDTLLTSAKIKQLEMELQKYYGRFVKFRVETDPGLRLDEPKMTLDPRFDISPEDIFSKNPDIRKIVERYDGKITSIKKITSKGADNG